MLAYLGLGSNLGDRLANLQAAVNFVDLRAGEVLRISKVYETAPMYVEDQPAFLNAAVELRTTLGPEELLAVLKQIEAEIGRIPREQNGPREIDIDLLALVPAANASTGSLILPHPKISERKFVLAPLADIEGGLAIGAFNVADALASPAIASQSVSVYAHGVLSIHGD